MAEVLAVCCGDLHISEKPSWRSPETDWFGAMARSLDEMNRVAEQYDVPVICAGDVTDRWYASPEVINFASRHLPKRVLCVRGNHDLPNHNHNEIHKSAYQTLVECGRIQDLREPFQINGMVIHPFPYGTELKPLENPDPDFIHVAVVHKYIWKDGHGHERATEDTRAIAYRELLKGYDVSVWGDNHQGFLIRSPRHTLINCGTFFRRKSDEKDYQPMIGLLWDDGNITPHFLDISEDKYLDKDVLKLEKPKADASKALAGFRGLSQDSLDFRAAVHFRLESDPPENRVKELVLGSLPKN